MGSGVALSCMGAACVSFRLYVWAVDEGAEAVGVCEDEV